MVQKFVEGTDVAFRPKNGGTFPTGEQVRYGTIESVEESEYVVRQHRDDFTRRIKEHQIM